MATSARARHAGLVVAALGPIALVSTLLGGAPGAAWAGSEVDLLRRTGATVWVSSWAGDNAYAPEKLVDGKLETAWNGRSGKLVGTKVGFFVPRATTPRRIELTVGFTATHPKHGDLFAKNHRIARVVLSRDGKQVGSFTLDPHKRTLQPIALPAGTRGGWFTLRVAAVRRGTTKWREVCISELRVYGEAPTTLLRRAKAPVVLLGAPLRRNVGDRRCSARAAKRVKSLAKVPLPVLLAALLPRYDPRHRVLRPVDGRIAACKGQRQTSDWKGEGRSGSVVTSTRKSLSGGRQLLIANLGVRRDDSSLAPSWVPHGFIATLHFDAATQRVVVDAVGTWVQEAGWSDCLDGATSSSKIGRIGRHLAYVVPVLMHCDGGGNASAGFNVYVEDGDQISKARTFQTLNRTSNGNGGEEVGRGCKWPDWSCAGSLAFARGLLRADERCWRRRRGGKTCRKRREKKTSSAFFGYRAGKLVLRKAAPRRRRPRR